MVERHLSDEEAQTIREILLNWKREGVVDPLLPSDFDVDGDGIVDAFGLNSQDELIFVSGTKLEDTVFASEGDEPAKHFGDEVIIEWSDE